MNTLSDHWDTFCSTLDTLPLTPPFILSFISSTSSSIGVSPSELKLFLCMFSGYPLALIFKYLLPKNNFFIKHVFSILTGFWILQFILGYQWIHCIIPCILVYSMLYLFGSKSRYITFLIAFGYLTGGHLYRMKVDYLGWTLDWTMQMMVITQKLSAFGFNYYDGTLNLNPTVHQKQRGFHQLPSIIQFLSFILFPINLSIGPAFEYNDYIALVQNQLIPESVQVENNPMKPNTTGVSTKVKPTGCEIASLWCFVQGVGYFVMHTAVSMYFPAFGQLTSKDFLQSGNVLVRWCKIWVSLLGYRFKYYFGWKFSEGCGILSGLGFNGIDKKQNTVLWNRLENVDVLGFEFSQSLRDASQSWNKTTNLWLRYYVYERIAYSGWNLYGTYFISAFWHGFYPGYYMFFMAVALATQVHRNFRRLMRPRFMMEDGVTPGRFKGVYDAFSFVVTNCTVNYFIISFVVLAFQASIDAFRCLYFMGHLTLLVSFVVFSSGLVPKPKSTRSADTKTE